jgi:hypothetical protein
MGFQQNADPYLIPTFKKVWEETKQKRLSNFAVIRRFKVYENKEKENTRQGVKNVSRQGIGDGN